VSAFVALARGGLQNPRRWIEVLLSSPRRPYITTWIRRMRQMAASAKGFAVGLGVVVYKNHANDDAFWVEQHRGIKLLCRCYHNPTNFTGSPVPRYFARPLPLMLCFSLGEYTRSHPAGTDYHFAIHCTANTTNTLVSLKESGRFFRLLSLRTTYHPPADESHSLFLCIATVMGLVLFNKCASALCLPTRRSRLM